MFDTFVEFLSKYATALATLGGALLALLGGFVGQWRRDSLRKKNLFKSLIWEMKSNAELCKINASRNSHQSRLYTLCYQDIRTSGYLADLGEETYMKLFLLYDEAYRVDDFLEKGTWLSASKWKELEQGSTELIRIIEQSVMRRLF